MQIRSIGTRLTIWYTSLFTLTFLLLASTAYALLSYSLSQEVNVALNGVAKVLAERAQVGSATFFPSDVDKLFRRFFGFSPLDRYFEMRDPRGQRDPQQPRPHAGKLPLSLRP